MSGSSIDLAGVTKLFGAAVALHPLTLSIAAGEIVVLLGPSGCGKTTLLRLIAGLEHPDGGTIRFGEQDVTRVPVERRQTGMVFQSYALFPNMSVADNVGYGLRIRRMAAEARRTKVAGLLELVGLTDLAQRRVTQLSGGQKQRVALARALAIEPRVLLLDEPLSALDAALRDRLRIEIATLLRQVGTTAVYVTHDQAEAMAIGDRIVVMNGGRIAQVGTPQDIYARPADAFVATFVGTMNCLRGPVRNGEMTVGSDLLPIGGPDRDATVWFRPEHGSLNRFDGCIVVTGTVTAATFFGATTRLTVLIEGGATLVVDAPAGSAPSVGARIAVYVRSSALIEFADKERQPC